MFGDSYTLENVFRQVYNYRTAYYTNYTVGAESLFQGKGHFLGNEGRLSKWILRPLEVSWDAVGGQERGRRLLSHRRYCIFSFKRGSVFQGTAHCADMYPPNPQTDPASLTAARQKIHDHLASWISGAYGSPPKASSLPSALLSILSFILLSLL